MQRKLSDEETTILSCERPEVKKIKYDLFICFFNYLKQSEMRFLFYLN